MRTIDDCTNHTFLIMLSVHLPSAIYKPFFKRKNADPCHRSMEIDSSSCLDSCCPAKRCRFIASAVFCAVTPGEIVAAT
eukprot:COSAG05_NODE_2860_length_2561_cov_4.612510_1_plen_79_part_00